MRKIYLLPLLLLFCTQIHAQSKRSYWSVGVNPFGFIEIFPAIGPSLSYRLSPRLELWSEGSYVFDGSYKVTNWKNLKGFRFIFQPRFYTNRSKTFFIAPEFRLRHYSYNATASFINSTTSDTLNNYRYKGAQLLVGGALVIGEQTILSRRRHLYLEVTAGIGAKQRHIKRNSVPAGYLYYHYVHPFSFNLFSTYEDNNIVEPYAPLGLRLLWKLNR